MALTVLLFALAAILVLLGFAGMLLPALPGPPLIFLGLVLAAWAEGFQYVGVWTLGIAALLTVMSLLLDFAAGALGARRYGASGRAVLGAALGTVFGLVLFNVPGLLIGPLLGATLGELSVRGDLRSAGRAGVGAFLGLLLSTVAQLTAGFAMVGLYVAVRLAQAGA